MGCGASSESTGKEPKSKTYPPPPKDPENDAWYLPVPVATLAEATGGRKIPGQFLVIHDNKKGDAPRLSVVCLADGTLKEVKIKDAGLNGAKDLECLWYVPKKQAGQKQHHLYFTMTSIGDGWMFKISKKHDGTYMAHGVKPFKLFCPPGENARNTNCEGARAFLDGGKLWLEYGSRGGMTEDKSTKIKPWLARMPLDIKAIQDGTFKCSPPALEVTYWPDTIDNDPHVRQCADMGQAVGMAKYGQLFAAAYDDEAHETHFRSYIMERLPGAQPGGVENLKPLFKIKGGKIEAIMDLTKDVSIFATDDEGKGAYITVIHRHGGMAWKVHVVPPNGADPRLYGVSGICPCDPAVKKKKEDSESEESEEEEEEEEEEEDDGDDRKDKDKDGDKKDRDDDKKDRDDDAKKSDAGDDAGDGGGDGDGGGLLGGGDD